jgi:hypothetical protein
MATPLLAWVEKAAISTTDLETTGGDLSTEQARQFLRDAITPTAILSRADTFDSGSKKFEIPKFSFGSRIMRGGNAAKRDLEGARVTGAKQSKPVTDQVTLSTELFKGEVPVPDEVFEDNIEREGFADTLMEEIAKAVGRDLEESAIKSSLADANLDFGLFDGLVQSLKLIDAAPGTINDGNIYNAVNDGSAKAMFKGMLTALPVRFRGLWDQLVIYANPATCDAYADELGSRATGLGDSNVESKVNLRYRGVEVVETPLLSGTQNAYDYGKVAVLCHSKNVKVGFHRRIRVEKFRDPREGNTSFLPTLRYDVKWAQPEATVLAENVPAF